MSGHHADDVLDGFLTALGMLAVLFPLIGGKRFEERKICFAHGVVQFDGFARIASVVVSGGDPGILIVGLNGGSRGSEDGAYAPSDYDFDIGEVGQDFGDGPFIGRGTLAHFGGGDAFDQAIEFFRGGGLQFDWVLALGVGQDALRVLLSGFRHWNLLLAAPRKGRLMRQTFGSARPCGDGRPRPSKPSEARQRSTTAGEPSVSSGHTKYVNRSSSKLPVHATASLNLPLFKSRKT